MATIQSTRAARGMRSNSTLRRSTAGPGSRRARAIEQPATDWFLVAIVLVLVVLGLIMAYSTTFYWSATSEGSPFTLFAKQLLYAVIGLVCFVVLSRIDYGIWRRWVLPAIAAAALSLVAVLIWGDTVFNARRTLLNGSLQPSEPAKIIILMYGAAWLASRREQVTSIRNGLAPFAVIVGLIVGFIVLQPDLSTSAIIFIAAAAMFFMAGASLYQILLVGCISVIAFIGLVNVFPHAMDRLQGFVGALGNPENTQYHIQQSLLAIGDGGLFGSGIGAGRQKFGLLPTPHTDSVFAVLAEELGLLGVVVTLGLYVLLAYRSLRVAQKAGNAFGSFWAIGIITWIMMQALLNLLAMTGMLPLPGVPVPFLSVGGSSLISILAACGILVSISRGSRVVDEDGVPGGDEGDEPFGGRFNYRASSSVRRRNSRSRPARPDRAQSPADDGAGATDLIGRDVKWSARLSSSNDRRWNSPDSPNASTFRWRTGRNGTGPRVPRGR
jgi:cell division protein FtsW